MLVVVLWKTTATKEAALECDVNNVLSFDKKICELRAKKLEIIQRFTFVDLFAGIGGFHLAAKNLGGECVYACEIDKSARETYLKNHNIKESIFAEDITKVDTKNIPSHDILFAGFPCQPFSQCGLKKGFDDVRGTLFFYIAKIIKAKNPKAFFLENVAHLMKHDDGRTIARIDSVLRGLRYSFYYKIVHASDFGIPQRRARLFMVGFKNKKSTFSFPEKQPLQSTMSDIMGGECSKKIGFTLRVGGKGSKIGGRHNWDGYIVDGVERRLSVQEGLAMMGLPPSFKLSESNRQAMKQLGNSVAIPAVQATIKSILKTLGYTYKNSTTESR